MKLELFVEGGGDNRSTRLAFRRKFAILVGKMVDKRPGIVACGSRRDAFNKFCAALRDGENDVLLLVDSEDLVSPQNVRRPWAHLAARKGDGWKKPKNAANEHAHLMAQCMESWFIADPDALKEHFGHGFKAAKLPQNPKVEEIAKEDVMSGLQSAAKETDKGEYHKTRDGFALIGKIDPFRVEERAPHAKRFFDILRRKLGAL